MISNVPTYNIIEKEPIEIRNNKPISRSTMEQFVKTLLFKFLKFVSTSSVCAGNRDDLQYYIVSL